MEFKGTKGDWKASEIMNFSDTLVAFISNGYKDIAQLRGCSTGEELEAEANAKLIACAPELLETLKNLVQAFYEDDVKMSYLEKAEDLIKKATTI